MIHSFVLMRVIHLRENPGGTLTGIPVAHEGTAKDANDDAPAGLVLPSGVIENFDACVKAYRRDEVCGHVLMQVAFKSDWATKNLDLKDFIN